jgi:hypothetical protein
MGRLETARASFVGRSRREPWFTPESTRRATKSMAMSAKKREHPAERCLASTPSPGAVVQLWPIEFVVFGPEILTEFTAKAPHGF